MSDMRLLYGTDLKRFLRRYRSQRQDLPDLVLLLQSVAYPVNVGATFRVADACRAKEVILTGITPRPPHPTIGKVARGKERRVPWSYAQTVEEPVARLREAGYLICAVEITSRAVPYYEFDYPERVCLVVGNEDHGVTQDTLALCDASVFVPMYGKGRSLNVHVALTVVAYHVLHAGLGH
ncbi:MAG: TrmH family RNA methyltransferase [Anaerolineales bacterium]